jgi:uncharacterized protein YcbK (DUF882 family)
VPVRTARRADFRTVSRAGARIGLAALLVIAGSKATHNAIANGDTRTISFHHLHTGEDLTVTYKRNGRYDDAALKKIDWLMRDWRQNQDIKMDPHLIDLVWEAQREVGSKGAIHVVCGYRAPTTNAMLRRRSSGVAEQSLHTHGKAMDFLIPDAKLDDLRAAGLRLQRGGVGFYPGSGWPFVHMDVGSVRHWPRMSHDQLVKVFPNGRTVHVPSDGQPLKGYAIALGDVARGRARSRRKHREAQRPRQPVRLRQEARSGRRGRRPVARAAGRRHGHDVGAGREWQPQEYLRLEFRTEERRTAGACAAAGAGCRTGPDAEGEAGRG